MIPSLDGKIFSNYFSMQVVFAYARDHEQRVALYFHIELIVSLAHNTVVLDYLCQAGERVLVRQVLDSLLVVRVHNASEYSETILELGLLASAATVRKKAVPITNVIR
jgi:hypothetical protein